MPCLLPLTTIGTHQTQQRLRTHEKLHWNIFFLFNFRNLKYYDDIKFQYKYTKPHQYIATGHICIEFNEVHFLLNYLPHAKSSHFHYTPSDCCLNSTISFRTIHNWKYPEWGNCISTVYTSHRLRDCISMCRPEDTYYQTAHRRTHLITIALLAMMVVVSCSMRVRCTALMMMIMLMPLRSKRSSLCRLFDDAFASGYVVRFKTPQNKHTHTLCFLAESLLLLLPKP